LDEVVRNNRILQMRIESAVSKTRLVDFLMKELGTLPIPRRKFLFGSLMGSYR
jgi:hypothetical protein